MINLILNAVWGLKPSAVNESAYIYMFSSAQPVYVFWLVNWINSYYDSCQYFLNYFGFILCRFFSFLCILPREVPLAFVVKLVWWCWILLTFACLGSSWLSVKSAWESCWVEYSWLWVLPSLELYHAFPFWLVEFLLRNQLITLWEFLCILSVIFPLLLLIIYLCL